MFIVMSICMLATPALCREERLNLSYEDSSPMACMLQSQPAMAQWSASHPDWRIDRWKCVARGMISEHI